MTKIGIALSGGGVAGFAHLGVLRALDEAGIRFHSIAGTSAGAVFAALYAHGYTPNQLIKWLPAINKRLLDYDYPTILAKLVRRGTRVQGLIKGKRFHQLMVHLLGEAAMSDLKIPAAIMATDLSRARQVIFSSHPLDKPDPDAEVVTDIRVADAVVASCSIPVLFRPFIHGDRILIDGGLLDNCPIAAVRALGADKVIAVDMTCAEPAEIPFHSIPSIIRRIVSIHLAFQAKRLTSLADLVLQPKVRTDNILDFSQAVDCMEGGYTHARKKIREVGEWITG